MRSEYKEWAAQYNESQPISFYNGAIAAWNHQQSKVDELQAKLEQAYEDIETFATAHQRECEFKAQFAKEKNELQKRVDASLIAFEKLKEEIIELHGQCDLHLIKYLEEKSQVLEQALRGGSNA